MKRKNYSTCKWWLIVATTCLVCLGANAQDCASPTLSFAGLFPVGPEISTTVGAGYTLAEHAVTNVRSVSVRPSATDLPVYIVATLANGKLTLTTNDQFAIFEKLDDKLLFLNVVAFTCSSGTVREMTFRQNIKEENNYAPLFSRELYDIKVPLPLPRDFNLMQFVDDGKGVVANDYDITKNTVTFSIDENDYFSVTSSGGSTRTEFHANLITKQTLTKIQPPLTLQVYAMDAWDPPRTAQARLTISGDPVIVFITPPEFEQSLYKTTYKSGDTFAPVRVALAAGTYDATVKYQVSGEDSAYFDVTWPSDGSSATVALRSGTQFDEAKTILSVTLSATRSGTDSVGRTAVVVELTSEPIVLPKFEETLYTGMIASDRIVTLDASIRLIPATTSGSVVGVQLGGDDGKYFTATLSNNQVAIARSTLLTDNVLKEKSFFLVNVQAVKASVGTGETLLVLSVAKTNQQAPHFEQLVYEGTVTETGVVNVPAVRISPESQVDGMVFNYSGDVSLFVITSNSTGTVSIAPNSITPEKLADRTYLLLTITGKLEDVETAHAVIVIKVLRAVVVLPKFSNTYLEGQLLEKTLELRLPNVELNAASFSSSTEVKLIDELGFFDILEYFPDNVFQVFLRASVTSASLRGLNRIPLTVEANNPNSDTVHCVITVDIVRVTPPVFERLIYDGVISESRQLIAPLTAKLSSDSVDETVQYSLEGTDATFFTLGPNVPTTEGVSVKLRAALTESEYESRDLFQLNLRATKQLATSDAVVPIVIYVKRSLVKIPKFEKPLYKSHVNAELQLLPFETIRLEQGSYLDSATVSIRNSNSDLFGVTLLQGVVTIRLLKDLDQASVNSLDRFEFIVECSNPEMASGYTTILVDIVRAIDPEFTELFYAGEVQETAKEIVFDKKIMLRVETVGSGTAYTIQGVDSALVRYVVASSDQSLSFFLRDEVTVEQLKGRSELAFVVVASNPQSSKAAAASCLVKISRETHPTFTQSSFVGKIVEGQTMVDFGDAPIAWETDTVTGATEFTIVAGPTVDLFEISVTEDRSAIAVRLRSDAKWDQVRSYVYFRLILQARNAGALPAQCTLVVEVVNQPTITPAFTKPIYRGSLQQGAMEVIFSAGETITVEPETIMPTFQYAISEGDAELFKVVLVDENKLKVSLADNVAAANIEGRDLLSFNININNQYSAVDTATVVITVKLDDIVSPAFGKLLYSGTILEGTKELRFEESIVLSAGTFTENTELGIGGTHARYFTFTRLGSRVDLILMDPVDWTELTSTVQYLSVYLQATNPGSDTATAFVLIDIETVRQPQFAHAAVHGYIESGSRDVVFMEGTELTIVSNSTEPGFQWNLAGEDYQLFDAALTDELFRFSLKDSVTELQLGSGALYRFSVTLKNPNSGTVESSVIVNRKLPTPLFTKPVYYGSFDEQLRLTLADVVELTGGSFIFGTTITAKESNVDFLTVEQIGRTVELKPSRSLTVGDFQGLQVVHLVLEARLNDDVQGTCSVLLTVPEGKYLKQSLSITPQGTLSLRQALVPNVYIFFVHATNIVARKQSSASVHLNVLNAYECTEGTKTSTVEQVLAVHHLDEERPHATIFPTQLDSSCAYELMSESPTDALHPYFSIDTDTNWLTVRSFNREDHVLFGDMMVPQFRLRLRLHCDTDTGNGATETRSLSKRSLVDTDSINYAPDLTVISIIVDDINDNNPVFTLPRTPASDAIHLGYPEPSLATRLMLTQLTQVWATDADEGLNAKIRYSLNEDATGHFMIDPTEGTVHPTRDALRETDRVMFDAVATDRDGAGDGRSTRLPLTVHRLASDQIAVVSLMMAEETTLDTVIEQINRQNGFYLQLLHQAYVPTIDPTTQRSSNRSARQTLDGQRAMRLVVYAFDDSLEPMKTDSIRSGIRRALPSIDSSAIVSIDEAVCSATSTACPEELSTRGSNAGLIASTSVLGALLLISLAVGSVLYMRYVRPLSKIASDPSDIVQLENDFDPSPPSTPPSKREREPMAPLDDAVPDRKISINIAGITMQESEDGSGDGQRLARTLTDRLDEEDEYGAPSGETFEPEMPNPEPKNVKFNEVVERIEVQDQHSDDDDDDEDDDNGGEVYEERL
uniref:Cadherin domain-containing protein n=1 Tax=Anopheles atroparvus TaxID=41427 RepID=A0A182J964_ANOAO